MSKYKWWLRKKEINKLQNDIDRIANQVLGEYSAMVTVSVNGTNVIQGYASRPGESTCMQGIYEMNAGDHIQVIKHDTVLCNETVPHAGRYTILVEVLNNHARMIVHEMRGAYESRIAS